MPDFRSINPISYTTASNQRPCAEPTRRRREVGRLCSDGAVQPDPSVVQAVFGKYQMRRFTKPPSSEGMADAQNSNQESHQ